jgi:hypothetical protein
VQTPKKAQKMSGLLQNSATSQKKNTRSGTNIEHFAKKCRNTHCTKSPLLCMLITSYERKRVKQAKRTKETSDASERRLSCFDSKRKTMCKQDNKFVRWIVV